MRAAISDAIAKIAPHLITWAHARSPLHFVFAFNVSIPANFIALRTRCVTILFDEATLFVLISFASSNVICVNIIKLMLFMQKIMQ